MSKIAKCTLLVSCALVAGCATIPTPSSALAAQYQAEQHLDGGQVSQCASPEIPLAITGLTRVAPETLAATPDLLGPGDRLQLTVSGDKDVLTGSYVIGANGHIILEGILDLKAAGRSRRAVEAELRRLLIAKGLIRDIAGNVHLRLAEAFAVQVSVSGAVFEPGLVRVGDRASDARATTIGNPASGDFNSGRSLATALRAAGGIRPDAAASSVYLVRGEMYAPVDVTPAFTGEMPADPQLASGDRIVVPTTGCFQGQFVRPSSVTSPGIRVYLSNLSRPSGGNGAAGINKDSSSFPYGVRMLEVLVSANCVGGSFLTSGRRAVLISRNLASGKAVVSSRHVAELVRKAESDAMNPYIMPGDAIACYDSSAMTVVDAISLLGSLLGPVALANGISK